jgi:hypothetical protein
MGDSRDQIRFDSPAVLRKWPSLYNRRSGSTSGGKPYFLLEGTLDDCMRALIAKPERGRHLYEIHTPPQHGVVSEVLSASDVAEIVRLRDYL